MASNAKSYLASLLPTFQKFVSLVHENLKRTLCTTGHCVSAIYLPRFKLILIIVLGLLTRKKPRIFFAMSVTTMLTMSTPMAAVIMGSFLSGMTPSKRSFKVKSSETLMLTRAIGTMMSLSLQVGPALLDRSLQTAQILHQWAGMYHYGHKIKPVMAIGGFLLYSCKAITGFRSRRASMCYLLAGLTTLGIIPFTRIFMLPTNKRIFEMKEMTNADCSEVGEPGELRELMEKWYRLQFTRSLFPLAGAIIGAATTLTTSG